MRILPLEEGDLGDVANLTGVLVIVEFEVLEVFLERVAHDDLVIQDLLQLIV